MGTGARTSTLVDATYVATSNVQNSHASKLRLEKGMDMGDIQTVWHPYNDHYNLRVSIGAGQMPGKGRDALRDCEAR